MAQTTRRISAVLILVAIFLGITSVQGIPVFAVGDDLPGVQVDGLLDEEYTFLATFELSGTGTDALAPGDLYGYQSDTQCYWLFAVDRSYNDNVYSQNDTAYLLLDGWTKDHDFKKLDKSDHGEFTINYGNNQSFSVYMDYVNQNPGGGNENYLAGTKSGQLSDSYSDGYAPQLSAVQTSLHWNLLNSGWQTGNLEAMLDESPPYNYNDSGLNYWEWQMIYEFSIPKSEMGGACGTITQAGGHNSPAKSGDATAQVGDYVWLDANNNGIQDDGEAAGVENVTVNLRNASNDALVRTTLTSATGKYLFANVSPGTYYVEFILPNGYVFTTRDAGAKDALDSDADLTNGTTADFTLPAGGSNLTLDAGLLLPTAPGISIKKYTNGEDADTPTGPLVAAGSTVTWTYEVRNTGNVPLSDVTVTDDKPGVIPVYISGDTDNDDLLDLAEVWLFRATGVATLGQYANIGTTTGTPPTGPNVSDTDPSHYLGTTPGISIKKYTNGQDADTPTGPIVAVGSTVTWTYEIRNTGSVTLSNITVTDDKPGVTPVYVSGDTNNDNILDLTEVWLYRATGHAVAGQYANIGTVEGTPPSGDKPKDEDPSHYLGAVPGISIKKYTNGEDADNPTGPLVLAGSTVTWLYEVRNTGNVALSNVTVTDDKPGVTPVYVSGDSDNDDLLDLTEVWLFQTTGTAVAGQYANIGTTTGTPPIGPEVSDTDPSHYFGTTPGISIKKYTNDEDADTPTGPLVLVGSTVTWRYEVRNTGNVALSDVTVTDNKQGVTPVYVSGDTNNDDLLDLAEVWIFQTTGTAVAGQYANIGTTTGTPPVGPDVSDTDPSHYFGAVPRIEIKKYTNGQDADTPTGPLVAIGSTVTWTYEVRNTGNVPLSDVTVTDNKQGVTPVYISGDTDNDDLLDLTEVWLFRTTGTAVAGQYANIGTTTGTPPVGPNVSDTDPSHYFGTTPGISIIKYTNGEDADTPTGPVVLVGSTITWTYEVRNTGNAALSNVTVTDNKPGVTPVYVSGDTDSDGQLDVDEVWLFRATGIAVAGQYANIGTVEGTPPTGDKPKDDNPSHYFGAVPGISIKKYTNGQDADTPTGPLVAIGSTVTWTYEVRNTGNVPLSDVTVTDDKPGVTPVYISGDTDGDNLLDLTEVWLFRTTGIAVAGQYANIGTTTGTPPAGPDVTDTDPSHYFGTTPGINIIKYTNGEDADTPTGPIVLVGSTITWTYEVHNTSDQVLSNIVVTDDQPGVTPVYLSGDTDADDKLDPGEVWIFQATGIAVAGQYANIGTVEGTPPTGDKPKDNNPSHYFGAVPGISIKKYTNGEDADTPTGPTVLVGSTVTWLYEVHNTGNVPLSNVTVTDNKPGVTPTYMSGDTDSDGLLDLTEVWLFQATGTAVVGQYANIGTTTGKPPVGPDVTDTDPSHYFGTTEITGSLGDRVWYDDNKNGIQDDGEQGVPGIRVDLYTAGNTFVMSDTTDANGGYLFTGLAAGGYYVVFAHPQGYTFTNYNVSGDSQDALDSDALVPAVQVSVSDGGEDGIFGEELTYTFVYTNSDATRPAINVVISTTIPVGTSFVVTNSSPGWICTDIMAGGVCTLTLPTLAANSSNSAAFVVLVGEEEANVPDELDLDVSLTQGTLARTQVVTLGEGESNLTVDAGVVRTLASLQTGTSTDPTSLPPVSQPDANDFIFLPSVQSEE